MWVCVCVCVCVFAESWITFLCMFVFVCVCCDLFTRVSHTDSSSAGKWVLNVLWKMCGIDVHMDPNIGKRLNALGITLTSLTGEEDPDEIADLNSVNMAD